MNQLTNLGLLAARSGWMWGHPLVPVNELPVACERAAGHTWQPRWTSKGSKCDSGSHQIMP